MLTTSHSHSNIFKMGIKKIQYGTREWIVDHAVFPAVHERCMGELLMTSEHTATDIEQALEFIIAFYHDRVKYIRTSVHYNPSFLGAVHYVASVLGLDRKTTE